NVFKSDFAELSLNNKFPKLHEKTIKLEKDIKKLISDYKRSAEHWNKEQACVRSHDAVRAKLNDYFDGRVGSRPHTQEYLNSIYEEGK
ncbi:PIN-like domain-containing protein, partial [Vibrio parahaemolyticus]